MKTSNYQAEYGGSAGGNVNLTTKSGTKEFHGSVYTYFRNEALNANSFFNNKNKAKSRTIDMSPAAPASAGRCISRGNSTKARTGCFFFFNDQYSYNGTPGALQQLTMPTALERQGISPRA